MCFLQETSLTLNLSNLPSFFQAQGAATVVYCVTSKELNKVGGHYFNNCSVCKPSDEAKNPETAAKLWKLSERLVRQITLNDSQVVDLQSMVG